MYEKPERTSGIYSPPSYANGHGKPAWKTTGSKSRYIKIGSVIALILLAFYVLVPGEKAKGKLKDSML